MAGISLVRSDLRSSDGPEVVDIALRDIDKRGPAGLHSTDKTPILVEDSVELQTGLAETPKTSDMISAETLKAITTPATTEATPYSCSLKVARAGASVV